MPRNQNRTRLLLHPLFALIIVSTPILGGCNYTASKSGSAESETFGFGSGSPSEKKALGVLSSNCAACHAGSSGAGRVSNILDPKSLIRDGLIVAGDPSGSPVITAIESGRMPPTGAMAAADLSALRDWIANNGGATGGVPASTDPLDLIDKNTPSLYFGTSTPVTLYWDLATTDASPVAARFPGLFVMEVNVQYQTVGKETLPIGYQFTNPRIQMYSGEVEADVQGIIVRVNGVQAKKIEPFLSARVTAKGIDPVNVYNGTVSSPLATVSTADKISVGFGYLNVRARSDNPPVPSNPTLASGVAYAATAQVPVTVGNDSTARRWCLTASSMPPTSTSAPCPGYENALTNGWVATRPTVFDLASIGRPLASGDVVTMSVWVANSDLKISAKPGVAQVTFDTTPPSIPTFASIFVSDTQIADIVGLQNNPDAVSWCLMDGSTMTSVQTSMGCTFTMAMPSFVGMKGSGTRFISIFAKDRAGNLSRSAIVTVTNPFLRISFDQLSNAVNGARAVFANRCVSCHGAGAPNQAQWDSTSYADSVAKKAQILDRIYNVTSPMPTGGLLAPKEQELLRLWLTQSATPVQI